MPMADFASRRTRLVQALAQEGLDALLVSNPLNVSYLTGFTGDSSHLIIGPTQTLLVSDGRWTEQLAQECKSLDAYIRPTTQLLPQATGEQLQALGMKNVGCESNHLTVADFQTIRELAKTVAWKPDKDRVETL